MMRTFMVVAGLLIAGNPAARFIPKTNSSI